VRENCNDIVNKQYFKRYRDKRSVLKRERIVKDTNEYLIRTDEETSCLMALGTFLLLLLVAASCLICVTSVNQSSNTVHQQVRDLESETLICTLFLIAIAPPLGVESSEFQDETTRCVSTSDKAYTVVNIPEDFFEPTPFISGSTQIEVEKLGIFGRFIDIKKGSGRILENIFRKTPVPREGDFTLAAIRVTAAGKNSPTDSAAQISDYLFGTYGDKLNLLTGYKTCSGGKVNFHPGVGQGLVNGVKEVEIPQYINFINMFYLEAYVTDELVKRGFDRSKYTHVMYILPTELERGGDAFAYLGGYLSVFYDTIARSNIIQMHEIGHNFNMAHSGEGTYEYGDGTGVMGFAASYEHDNPLYCFNAAKSWWFGWYSDRHVEINPIESSMMGKMIGVNDYLAGQASMEDPDQYTISRVIGSGEEDLYFMYNRQEGITSGVYEYADQVVIVKQAGDSVISTIEAPLSEGLHYTKENWAGTSYNLIIKVCYMSMGSPDYAYVIVFLEGLNDRDCGTPKPTVSFAPSSSTDTPTPEPSMQPTPEPTPVPTTAKPTRKRNCPSSLRPGTIQYLGFGPHDCYLPACTGDCDTDQECARGLKCYRRNFDSDPVPGCYGYPYLDFDYCIRPTPAPSSSPSTSHPTLSPVPTLTSAPTLTLAPSLSPTSAASLSPTSATSLSPTIVCVNDRTFRLNGKKIKSCSWISRNKNRRSNLCSKKVYVRNACPMSCGLCCANDLTYKFKAKKDGSKRTCKWLNRKSRTGKYCKRSKIEANCPIACKFCQDFVSIASSPSL